MAWKEGNNNSAEQFKRSAEFVFTVSADDPEYCYHRNFTYYHGSTMNNSPPLAGNKPIIDIFFAIMKYYAQLSNKSKFN